MSGPESTGSFSVDGEGGRVAFEVLGYENPQPLTVSDANWLRVRIQLDAGGCTLRLEVALTTHDLKRFCDELENVLATLDGLASLAPDEEAITLRVSLGKTGTAQVFGELKERGAAKVRVEFEFDSDQSFLARTLLDIRDIQRRCPIVESV